MCFLCDGQSHVATRGDTREAHENKVYYTHRSFGNKVIACHKEAGSAKQMESKDAAQGPVAFVGGLVGIH